MAPPKTGPYTNPYSSTISDYYVQQYMQTHYQRYNQMIAIAQSEAQLSVENQAAQRKLMAAQAKDLRRYVTAMERDLTNYIDRKGSSSATEDMALLRMYVDVQKAKAQQSAQAQQRRIAIDKAADSHYAPNSSTVRAITGAGEEIQTRVALAGTDEARKNIALVEIGKISVQEPGAGSSVAEAQATLNTIKQSYVKAGVPGSFAAKEAEIKTAIYNHYGLGGYRAQTAKDGSAIYVVPSGNDIFDMDLQENTGKVKSTKRKQEGAPVTGGLSEAQTKIMDKMAGKGKAPTAEEVKQAVAIFQTHPDYGVLVDELSNDGQITEDEYILFSDRVQVEGKNGPPAILQYYANLKNNPATQTADVPEYQKLIFDPNFIRKVGQLGGYQEQLDIAEEGASKPLEMESWESIQQRGRQYYDPMRMKGSPRAGQTITITGTDGQPVSIPISQIKDMQREFDGFLEGNPEMAHDFGLIQEGYGMASSIKGPPKDLAKDSAQHMGYQMHVQYKKKDLGQIKDPLEFYKIASEIAGGDTRKRDDIVKWFHAYNMVPQQNAMAGVELSPAGSKLRDQFLKEIEEAAAAQAKEEERAQAEIAVEDFEGPSFVVEDALPESVYKRAVKNPEQTFKVIQNDTAYFIKGSEIVNMGSEVEGKYVALPPNEYQTKMMEAIVTRDVTLDPRMVNMPKQPEVKGAAPVEGGAVKPSDAKAASEPVVPVKEEVAVEEVAVEQRPFPINTNLLNTTSYNYQVSGYGPDGRPDFIYVGADGQPNASIVMKPGMEREAQSAYDKKIKAAGK